MTNISSRFGDFPSVGAPDGSAVLEKSRLARYGRNFAGAAVLCSPFPEGGKSLGIVLGSFCLSSRSGANKSPFFCKVSSADSGERKKKDRSDFSTARATSFQSNGNETVGLSPLARSE